MEYKKLTNLENKYPTIQNYKKEGDSFIVLNGLYADRNKVKFAKPSLNSITPIKATSFRFILKIINNQLDKEPKFFTSEKYFQDLQSSLSENNPYFPLESIKKEFVVTISLDDMIERYIQNETKEKQWGVTFKKNIFLSKDKIDYEDLISYIDWLVDTPNRLEVDSGGVLSADKLGLWTSASLNFSTLDYTPSTGIEIPTQIKKYTKADEDRLDKLEKDLEKWNGRLKNPLLTAASFIFTAGYSQAAIALKISSIKSEIEKIKMKYN